MKYLYEPKTDNYICNDIVIISKTREILENAIREITSGGSRMGLEINADKAKIIIICQKYENSIIKIGGFELEKVEKLKYLGVTVTNTGNRRKKH